MKRLQTLILGHIEDEEDFDNNYSNIEKLLKDNKILESRHEFKSFLCLIVKIANNHYRTQDFFHKIEQVLSLIKIKQTFSNHEIFNIFKNNKRLLLYLIEEKILQVDKFIAFKMTNDQRYKNDQYPMYFYPEIKPFINESIQFNFTEPFEPPEDFNEKRKIGENDDYICKLIQNDSVEEFISYTNKINFSLRSNIQISVYETNLFLLKNKYNYISLIEYSAFYGSIQIFKYLFMNNAILTQSLWFYAIHGNNPEIIHFLEENRVTLPIGSYKSCLLESIKCHHIEIANYITNNFLQHDKSTFIAFFSLSLKYYNFAFIQKEYIKKSAFFVFCYYGNFPLIQIIMKDEYIDLNTKIILIIFLLLMKFFKIKFINIIPKSNEFLNKIQNICILTTFFYYEI